VIVDKNNDTSVQSLINDHVHLNNNILDPILELVEGAGDIITSRSLQHLFINKGTISEKE
jgi:hypothetical protein